MKIRVVTKEPGAMPRIREIENDLEAMQAAIGGGHLELVRFEFSGTEFDLWLDEDGKRKGLAPNFHLQGPLNADTVVGPVMIARGNAEGDTVGLSAEEAIKVLAWFLGS